MIESIFKSFYLNRIAVLAVLTVTSCEKLPTEVAGPAPSFIRGITLADWTADGYASESSRKVILALRSAGASHMAILVTGYQATRSSNKVFVDPSRTPTQAAVAQAIDWAQASGLQVVLKPQILSNDGGWPGQLEPSDPEAWFSSYIDFVLPLALLAESVGAIQFIVGTELGKTIQQKELWQETIDRIKSVYNGQLTYAASWDEVDKVPFWNELDVVGVDFYFPVANRKNPNQLEILAAWQPWLQTVELLHKQTGRDILFTEIGYRSIDGAGMKPYQFNNPGTVDLQEQADLYWAALQSTVDIPWLKGMYWWNWLADGSGGEANRDYTPFGKPAESVLTKSWNRE